MNRAHKSSRLIATLLAGFALSSSASAEGYLFTDLGTLGGVNSYAKAINNAGQVVGFTSTSNGNSHAILWNGTTATDLGGGTALAINNSGQIAGTSYASSNTWHATLWNGGVRTDIGAQRGGHSGAYGINNLGQIVGWGPSFINYSINDNIQHASLWEGGKTTDYGSLYGPNRYSWATGINDAGQIVGYSSIDASKLRATLWSYNGTMTDLGTLGGTTSSATAINNAGQVAGYASIASGMSHAALWNGTTATDLGTLGGSESWAYAINNNGQVVGASTVTSSYGVRATLWNGTVATDLNTFLDASTVNAGWILTRANGINDNGWIVGDASNVLTGQSRAFLLTPVPEPEVWVMLLAGLGLVGCAAKRRKACVAG